eukprot:jgi/Phyca11/20102/fgenesh1_pg.PHYCAscaffold_58_\
MVVQRRPMDVEAEVPTAVYALDLQRGRTSPLRLLAMTLCTLPIKWKWTLTNPPAVHRVPVLYPHYLLADQALHILTQLYAAGVERVVVSVAAAGGQIMAAVKQTPFYTKMKIEFLDLGRRNDDGHARSILATRSMFPGPEPFLIHTADHIFDKSVVSKLSAYPLGNAVACVLVETDIAELTGLPPTTVKVKVNDDHQHVVHIGRDLDIYDGIDAGLFLSSPDIFDALDALAGQKSYFSLAEALDSFTSKTAATGSSRLTYLPTAGETWFSIETEEQLAYTQDTDGTAKLSPWTVFLASTPVGDPSLTKNVVIGVSAPDPDMSLRVAGNTDSSKLFKGFVVGVGNSDYPVEEEEGVDVDVEGATPSGAFDSESRPLLSKT